MSSVRSARETIAVVQKAANDLPRTRVDAIRWYAGLWAAADRKDEGKEYPYYRVQTERWLGTIDLFYLLTYLLRRHDLSTDWLFERIRMVQSEPNGCLDLWAREHGKSSIITFGLTIFDILRDPEITVGIFSHTRPVAKKFLIQIKQEFETNTLLKQLFADVLWEHPAKEAPRWSEDGGIIVKRRGNPKESTVEAWGLVDGQPTGSHFRLRVYDDVVTRESVTTPDQVDKTTKAWELSDNLGIKAEDGGIFRMIGTRYSLFDTYADVIKRGAAKPRIYPATHNGRMDGRPVLFSEAEWQRRLSRQSRSTIASQLLQNPMADESATFNTVWLKPYEVRPRTMNVYILCDPSLGRSRTSDNTAMGVIGLSGTGGKYLLDGYCHRMGLDEKWRRLKHLYRKWSTAKGVMHIGVGYERYGAQVDVEYFKQEQEREKLFFPIDELNWTRDNTESKRERVERLEPDFRNGRFYLPLAVYHDGRPCVWAVDTDSNSRSYGDVSYRPTTGLTKRQMGAVEGGSADLVAKAIKSTDQEGRVYDLTVHFIEEYANFPFGQYKDLIDACSRIYDMEPRPPQILSKDLTEPNIYWDS